MIRIKLFRNPFHRNQYEVKTEIVHFSTELSLEEADGILAYFSPVPELLSYQGVKAWFTFESLQHSRFRKRNIWRATLETLNHEEFLHFANADLAVRIPHPTCAEHELVMDENSERVPRAVAAVTNFGGRFWGMKAGPRQRTKFVINKYVDLYGSEDSWKDYRNFYGFGFKGAPKNFKGSGPTRWHGSEKHIPFLSGFKVNVALEPYTAPFYFGEKLVNAARAGCIPVYHAHPTVRDTFLVGAKWVDPADFEFNVAATIKFALAEPLEAYQAANRDWLARGPVRKTTYEAVWSKLADYFVRRLTSKRRG